MGQVVFVDHVTRSAQIKVKTLGALPSNALYASFFAVIANYIGMANAYGRVIEDAQIVFALVADAVVGPRTRVPLYNHCLIGRGLAAWFTDLHYGTAVSYACFYFYGEIS